jgi:hypothetical protein
VSPAPRVALNFQLIITLENIMRSISNILKSLCTSRTLVFAGLLACGSAQALTVPVAGQDVYARIDGVGSLVDARSGGSCSSIGNFGCTRDEIVLQGDGTYQSAGLFQVLKDQYYCNSVTLTGLPTQGSLLLVKSWNERFPTDLAHQYSRAYETFSGTAVIPLATNTDWSTIAIVSQSPLPNGTQRSVTATCNSSLAQSGVSLVYNYAGGLGKIVLVDTLSWSAWTGNGSLISVSGNYATTDSAGGYGRNRDVVNEFGDGLFSVQYFQIYNSNSCKNIRITSNAGAVAYRVRSKEWSAANWITRVGTSSSLPITMSVSTSGFTGYYLIAVEMLSNSTRNGITASCV